MEALVEKLCNRFSGVTGMHSLNITQLIIFPFAKFDYPLLDLDV